MSRAAILFYSLLAFLPLGRAATQPCTLRPQALTTEHQTNPIGIGTAQPTFAWTLGATDPGSRNLRQTAYRILLATSPATLNPAHALWDSGRVPDPTFWQLPYAGPALQSSTTYLWSVQVWSGDDPNPGSWSPPARFTTAKLHPADWSARWIAAEPDSPHPGTQYPADPPPLPVFRQTFTLPHKKVASALLSVAGLGQYEIHLNGRNVTDTVLNPAWTDYRKSIPFNTFDVASLITQGSNAFAVLLGNGMYNVQDVKGHYTKFAASFGQPKLLLQLDLRFADGTSATIASDPTWQTRPGPILYSSIYGGETFDASALPADWDLPNADPHGWHSAVEVAGPGGTLTSSPSAPLIIAQSYPALHPATPKPGITVYDLGATISGWPSLTVQGPPGARITLLPGELLNSDGTVTQRSVNAFPADPVLFQYLLRGGSPETWHPRFSYTSFRYLQVTTSTPQTTVLNIAGDFVHARASIVGTFTSSNPLFDRIHTLIDRAVLSNLASVVTDCPSREKLGWLEQTYLNASTLMLNFDVTGLYEKMADDIAGTQLPSGLVPSIAPEYVAFLDANGKSNAFRDSPEWGSAIILAPWALFQYTGDTRPLTRHYLEMQRYIAFLQTRATGNLLSHGLGDWYDIGPKAPGPSQLTSRQVTATGVFFEDLQTLARIATLLHHPEDAARYTRQAEDVRAAFNAALFHPETNQYDRGSQTANAIPLALGLVPSGHAPAVLANLIADIHAHADHVTSGDIGFHYVVRALTEAGRSDVLAAMFSRTDAPSYGFQLAKGATTLTEAWDANPESSQNHFMLGHGEEWFYRGLAGLKVDMALPAAEAITFQPSFLPGLAHASAGYQTPMGLATIAWTQEPTQNPYVLITVPPSAEAHLLLPPTSTWQESGHPAPPDQTLGSGTYRFTASSAPATIQPR